MTATAAGTAGRREEQVSQSTIGLKAVMAITGLILFGFVFVHLLGNIQVFEGKEKIDHYGELLRVYPGLLWTVRSILLLAVLLHIWAYIQLGVRKLKARPIGYVKKKTAGSNIAARTMYWSGPVIALFVVLHIFHFTTGTLAGSTFRDGKIWENMVGAFHSVPVAVGYIIAMILLCGHLYHGLWSWLQSLGINHPRYTPIFKRIAAVIAVVICLGFISIPVAIVTGLYPQ